jgi:hypothetical protein
VSLSSSKANSIADTLAQGTYTGNIP